jgi:hypothetical protein
MTNGKTNPPKRAIWFLRHACPGDNEALAGDLIETFAKERRAAGSGGRCSLLFSLVFRAR